MFIVVFYYVLAPKAIDDTLVPHHHRVYKQVQNWTLAKYFGVLRNGTVRNQNEFENLEPQK
jgi:hypothetical protein